MQISLQPNHSLSGQEGGKLLYGHSCEQPDLRGRPVPGLVPAAVPHPLLSQGLPPDEAPPEIVHVPVVCTRQLCADTYYRPLPNAF